MNEQTRRDLEAAKAATHKRGSLWFGALVLETDRRVREKTPVDTGYARGNWNIASGAPDDTVLQDRLEGSGPAAPKTGQTEGLQIGDTAFVTSAVPYMDALEHGHSRQAPSGMVRITATELSSVAEQIAAKVSVL